MRKKRLWAFALAASMLFTSVSWADVGMWRQGAGQEEKGSWYFEDSETASASEANKRATFSNAFYRAGQATSFEILAVGGKNTIGCFDKLKLQISGVIGDRGQYKLYGRKPSGSELLLRIYSASANPSVDDVVDVSRVYADSYQKLGEYEFYVVDEDNRVMGTKLKIQVGKQPKLKVALKNKIFGKQYMQPEPDQISYVGGSNIEIFDSGNDNEASSIAITNLRFEREAGEDPGKYLITKLSCDQIDEIELVQNEYSYFEISKATKFVRTTPANVRLTGSLQIIDVLNYFYLQDKEIPTKVVMGELSEENKAYFTELPTVEGTKIKFSLKQLQDPYTFEIPLTMENNYYTYTQGSGEQLKLTVNTVDDKRVEQHTEEEIRDFYSVHQFNQAQSDRWTKAPDASAENPGELSEETLENVLNALNFMRFIAGIPSEVTINEEYQTFAQAGATLLIRNGKMEHTPSKPAGVSDEFYALGYRGTSSSNLAMGYSNLPGALINGWMDDGDARNIDAVGHRRWCLDPNMTQTGFGHSGSYTSMYVFDDLNDSGNLDYDFIPWPAQTMPLDYFRGPWMVTLSTNRYDVSGDNEKDIKVTLTSKDTGKTYTLDSTNKNMSGKYFNLNTGGSGHGPAVIFEPKVSFSSGDEVTVRITGLKDHYGSPETIEYTVKFFRMSSGGGSTGGGGSSGGGGGSTGGGGSSGGGGGSAGGGGSSGGGGGSAGGGPGAGKAGITGKTGGNGSLPGYVSKGSWTAGADGRWKFADLSGTVYANRWAAVENPYANAALGQEAFDWFFFDGEGNMVTGWHVDADGSRYYLNPNSDGTRGRMVTGWNWIADQNGIKRCYYFNPNSDGTRGRMLTNTVIDGKTINANGEWVVNGVVQTQ